VPKITFTDVNSEDTVVEAETGQTLMSAAFSVGVQGIDAHCGGQCACATCHIYVPAEWQSTLDEKTLIESQMLEVEDHVTDNSRLSCQIIVTDEMDGMKVTVAHR